MRSHVRCRLRIYTCSRSVACLTKTQTLLVVSLSFSVCVCTQKRCKLRHPPGNEIYRSDEQNIRISVFEVDGHKERVYCQVKTFGNLA